MERKGMNIEEARRCIQDLDTWMRVVYSCFVAVCLSVGWVGDALACLAVTNWNSEVGRMLSNQCMGHPETSSGSGPVMKKML
jgi:hypothetical protein